MENTIETITRDSTQDIESQILKYQVVKLLYKQKLIILLKFNMACNCFFLIVRFIYVNSTHYITM